jgi:hypothetical protein
MWWKAFKEVFLPGVGYVDKPPLAPAIPVNKDGIKLPTFNGTRFLQPAAKKNPKSVFICSSSICFRKRIGRIIYGKEGEDILL